MSVESTAERPAGSPSNESEVLTFWLEMHVPEFEPLRSEFLNDLADLVEVEIGQLRIDSIVNGCSKVTLRVPLKAYQRIVNELTSNAIHPEWLAFKPLLSKTGLSFL